MKPTIPVASLKQQLPTVSIKSSTDSTQQQQQQQPINLTPNTNIITSTTNTTSTNNLTASNKSVNSCNSIKVINISQLQQKNGSSLLSSNKITQNFVKLNNTNTNTSFSVAQTAMPNSTTNNSQLNSSTSYHTEATTNNATSNGIPVTPTATVPTNTIKITKVVSARSQLNANLLESRTMDTTHNGSANLVYYNKINNQLVPISQPNLKQINTATFINRNPTATSATQAISRDNTKNSQVSTIPKFYTTSKMFATHYVNHNTNVNNLKFPINAGNTSNGTSSSSSSIQSNGASHLNTLNSNLSRFATQANANNGAATTVTINPRYLMNINNPNSSLTNSNAATSNLANTNANATSAMNACNTYLPASNSFYQQQHHHHHHPQPIHNVEPDEEVVVEEEEELGHAETYANYMPTKCKANICFFFAAFFI